MKNTAEMSVVRGGEEKMVWFQVTGAPLNSVSGNCAVLTLNEISELIHLRNLMPICMHCRKVRDDEDYWHRIEEYLSLRENVKFTHGICPDCYKESYPKFYVEK